MISVKKKKTVPQTLNSRQYSLLWFGQASPKQSTQVLLFVPYLCLHNLTRNLWPTVQGQRFSLVNHLTRWSPSHWHTSYFVYVCECLCALSVSLVCGKERPRHPLPLKSWPCTPETFWNSAHPLHAYVCVCVCRKSLRSVLWELSSGTSSQKELLIFLPCLSTRNIHFLPLS